MRCAELEGMWRRIFPRIPITIYDSQTWIGNIIRSILVDNFHIWWCSDVEGGSADVALVLQIKGARNDRQHIGGCVTGLQVAPFWSRMSAEYYTKSTSTTYLCSTGTAKHASFRQRCCPGHNRSGCSGQSIGQVFRRRSETIRSGCSSLRIHSVSASVCHLAYG